MNRQMESIAIPEKSWQEIFMVCIFSNVRGDVCSEKNSVCGRKL